MNTNAELKVIAVNDFLKKTNADFFVKTKKVFKPNGEWDAFILYSDKYNCCPTIYPTEEMLQKSVEELATELKSLFEMHARNFDAQDITTSDYVLENVLPRMVSSSNSKLLEEHHIPYIPYLDLLIYFYVPVSNIPIVDDMEIGCMQVSDYLLKKMDLTLDEIYQVALQNLDNSYQIINLCQLLQQLFPSFSQELEEMSLDEADFPAWIITNEKRLYGASGMLSRKALSEIKNLIGNRFLLLPSSIHEVICVPYANDLSGALAMVTEINAGCVKPEEVLSNNVYVFEDESLHQLALEI